MGKFDPKNVADYEPDIALDKGWYIWKVTNLKEDVSSKTGNAMLIIDIVCQEGQEQSDGKSPVGHEATLFLLTEFDDLSDAGKRMSQKNLTGFIAACGFSLKKAFDWDDLVANDAEFEGYVKPEEYEGEMKTAIKKFRPLEEEEEEE